MKPDIMELAKKVHANAVAHGWWEEERPDYELCALIHSELSEALEEYRTGRPMVWYSCADDESECFGECPCSQNGHCSRDLKKPEGIAVELADAVIRILDWIGHGGEEAKVSVYIKIFEAISDNPIVDILTEQIAALHALVSAAYIADGQEQIRIISSVIPVIDMFLKKQDVNLWEVVEIKMAYNETRPYRHGGKKC